MNVPIKPQVTGPMLLESVQAPGDAQLLERLRGGDERAFTELYERRSGPVYRFALNMCGRESVAEEVVQEVFLAVIRGAKYRPELGSVSSWMFGMARNQVLKHLGRGMRFEPLPEEADAGEMDGEDALILAESLDGLREAIGGLPELYREVLVLCDLEELSYEDAAKAIGCPLGTLRSRLHRARALLAAKLGARVAARKQA